MAAENSEPIDAMTSNLSIDDDAPIIEKWSPVVDAMTETTQAAFADSPSFDPEAPEAFQSYWRDVFTRLRESIVANEEMPKYLTQPPVTKFTATFFDAIDGLGCPCCHPKVEPNIVLQNPNGVTSEELVDGFTKAMYGEVLPRVYIEPGAEPLDEDEASAEANEEEADDAEESDDESLEEGLSNADSGALTYACHWTRPSGEEPESGGSLSWNEPHIVFYCAEPDDYQKRKDKEDRRMAAIEERIKAREEEAKIDTKKATKL